MARNFFILQNVSPSVGVLLLRNQVLSTIECFRRYNCFVGSTLYLGPALGCFRCYIYLFRRLKTIHCLLFRVLFEFQFPVWIIMLMDCMAMFMVGVDRWLSAFLYSLASSTNVSFFRLYHHNLVSFCCFWKVGLVCEVLRLGGLNLPSIGAILLFLKRVFLSLAA